MLTWECDKCQERVKGKDGYICISYTEIGEAKSSHKKWDEERAARGPWTAINLASANLPKRARWRVCHFECDPNPESTDYWIWVDHVSTWPKLCAFTAHLMGKKWFEVTDWDRILRNAVTRHRQNYAETRNVSKATQWVAGNALAGEGE